MILDRLLPRLLPLTTVLVLSACGGDGVPSADAEAAVAGDSAIKPIERTPLTDADLLGLARADISLEVPWTQNRISRQPSPSQGPAWLESVEVSGGEGFARALFTFSDIAFFPGYEVDFLEAGAVVPCGEAGKPLSLPGDRVLVLRFRPANAHDGKGGSVPVRTRTLSPEQFTEGGLVCDLNDQVVWAAGLSSGDQVRVLELRNPKRVAVDIR